MRKQRHPGYRWYRLRGWLMVPPGILMFFCRICELESEVVTFSVGGAIFAAGILLRIWAQMHMHYRLKVKKILTTSGPYAYTRNPLYIANTLLLVSLCVMSELIWLCPFVLLYCAAVYTLVVRYEEWHLTAKYGQPYVEYLRCVPRWLPRRERCEPHARVDAREFLYRSIGWQIHNVLLLSVPILKEVL